MLLISKKASYFISLLLFSFAVHASQEHEKNRQKPITEITSPIALIQFEKKHQEVCGYILQKLALMVVG